MIKSTEVRNKEQSSRKSAGSVLQLSTSSSPTNSQQDQSISEEQNSQAANELLYQSIREAYRATESLLPANRISPSGKPKDSLTDSQKGKSVN
jgi:hypothetical protein